MTRNSLSLDLAEWTLGLRYEDLPERVVADVKLRVLDTLGLIVSGAATRMGRAVHAASTGLGSGRRARLIPSGKRTSAPTAALAHGTQAHAEDFDDTHNESIMHSSAPVVATVLALGESMRASGEEAIVLVAAGNELNCRLGCAAPGRFHDHGFHPTSVLGSITSAILAGRMLGLDASGTVHAAGIAGSQASGILEAYEDGTWSKTLHPGWAAHAGVTAGMLARAGFTGPRTVLEGRFGVYRSFLPGSGQSFDFERITAGLGDTWEQLDSSFKPYPCAHAIHSFVDAVLEVRAALGLRPGDVAGIEATVAPHFVKLICEPRGLKIRPRSPTHARASLQYAVAAALHAGSLGPEHYTEASIEAPAVLALAEKVSWTLDPSPPPTTQYGGVVTIETVDGRRKTAVMTHNRGSRENPMTDDELVGKFNTCARSLNPGRRRRIIERVFGLESVESVEELVSECTRAASRTRRSSTRAPGR